MTNINRYLLALFGVLFFAGVAQARVCFLPGGEDEAEFCLESVPYNNCPNQVTCEHPQSGAEACEEEDDTLRYNPEQCCDNEEYYVQCPDGSTCESGYECTSSGYKSCRKGHCKCPSYYKLCDTNHGQIGIGEACSDSEGEKYAECQCDGNKYRVCDRSATGSGESCTDDRGEHYTQCTCPSDWATSSDSCLCGVEDECTSYPSGRKAYSCRGNNPPACKCGYTYKSSYAGCAEGCTDDEYDFVGSIPDGYACDVTTGLNGNVCGKNCKCTPQNWDTEDCTYPDCDSMGYTEQNCEGDWVACPYDSSKKKCIGGGDEDDDCPDGYSADYQSLEDCRQSGCWDYKSDGFSGNKKCGKCLPTRPGLPMPEFNATCNKWIMCNNEETCANWECDPGTTLINGQCVSDLKSCPDGFSLNYTSVDDCGNPKGWTLQVLGALDGKLCARCMAKVCTGSYKTEAQCTASGSLTQSCTVSGSPQGYAGDDGCYTCNCVDTCPSGYSTAYQSVNDCGDHPSGWKYTTYGTLNGLNCGKCTPQACPGSYLTLSDCLAQATDSNTFCEVSGSSWGYSGEELCYDCLCRKECLYDCSDCGGPECSIDRVYGTAPCECSLYMSRH